ncbi:hypothetical protein B9479_008272, partial [Cryptococcus floricola]
VSRLLRAAVAAIRADPAGFGGHFNALNLVAAYTLAFAGFLRSGEFTYEAGLFDIAFDLARIHFQDGEVASVLLPYSKTDPTHQGVLIALPRGVDPDVCPVRALRGLRAAYPAPPTAPLFSLAGGAPSFPRHLVVDLYLNRALRRAGFTQRFTGHSFRRAPRSLEGRLVPPLHPTLPCREPDLGVFHLPFQPFSFGPPAGRTITNIRIRMNDALNTPWNSHEVQRFVDLLDAQRGGWYPDEDKEVDSENHLIPVAAIHFWAKKHIAYRSYEARKRLEGDPGKIGRQDFSKKEQIRRKRLCDHLAAVRERLPEPFSQIQYECLLIPQIHRGTVGQGFEQWAEDEWMSPMLMEMLNNLYRATKDYRRITAPKEFSNIAVRRESSGRGGEFEREMGPFGASGRSTKFEGAAYPQRWMFSDSWLRDCGELYERKIVPVMEPTSYADIRTSQWFISNNKHLA